jgi:PAS domain S-box-containing protein
MNIKKFTDQLLNISATDPDDARKRKILNLLLVSVGGVSILAFFYTLALLLGRAVQWNDVNFIVVGSFVAFVGVGCIYYVNLKWSGSAAAFMFLGFMTLIFSFSDSPQEVSNGRTLFAFTMPIIMASVLLAPWSSFIFALLSSIIISFIAVSIGIIPNYPAMFGFFLIALVSWLSSSSLEQALGDLRATNANLDKLVQERTKALSESFTREMIEAGRSKAILNSIADGVIVFDNSRKSILANPALTNLIGMPFGEVIGRNLDELLADERIPPNSREQLLSLLNKPGPGGESFRLEWGKKTLSVNAAQVYDSTGEHIGAVAVFRDFTREAEVERMKSTFVAVVSHELRTPLNAILGYAEMLKEAVYGPINEKQAGATDRIMINTQHLLGIVSDLLDQAQIEAGRLKIQIKPFSPAKMLEDVHSVMDKVAADKKLTLTSEIDSHLPAQLDGDAYRLRQVIINLANNAVKFTGQGGVHIRLFCHDADRWGISVQDTGDGIPKDEIPHIFETFRQVDGTATRQYGGIGLGLSIVKQLVDLMQGEIVVESELGSGSTFTILLPLNVTSH